MAARCPSTRRLCCDRRDVPTAVRAQRVAVQTEQLGLFIFAVDGANERAALGGEQRLCALGVTELPVRVLAAGFDHSTTR
jgi:hypothetical protein